MLGVRLGPAHTYCFLEFLWLCVVVELTETSRVPYYVYDLGEDVRVLYTTIVFCTPSLLAMTHVCAPFFPPFRDLAGNQLLVRPENKLLICCAWTLDGQCGLRLC